MKKENAASSAVALSNGMSLIEEFTDDENELSVVYGITRGVWNKGKENMA